MSDPARPRSIRLIVNPSAGGGRAAGVLPEVEDALRALGLSFVTEHTRDIEHARTLARDAAAAGEMVVTLSGDGLVGAVAGALAGVPGAVLGILPGGRGNDFARVLGIPLDDLPAACAVLRDGVERSIDVGQVDGRPFIGIASLGFDSDANRIANEAPARLGSLVYAYGAIRALIGWRPARYTLELADGERHVISGWSVGACNSKAYGGGMMVAPDASLTDGELDVVVCDDRLSKRRFLTTMLPRVFKGTHVLMEEVHVFRSASVRITADRPFTIYADGDPIGEVPATFTVLPGALRVVCPA